MVKITFKDIIAQFTNRYIMTPVAGQADTYTVTPSRGTVAQAGTPVSAATMNQLQDNIETDLNGKIDAIQKGAASGIAPLNASTKIDTTYLSFATQAVAEAGTDNTGIMTPLRSFQQLQSKSDAMSPTVGGNATTRDLTVPANTNPKRLTLLLTSSVTATSAIRLRIGTGSYYPLIWPKSGTVVNILSLLAGTPYDLVFNGSAWIVKDYVESGSNANGSWVKYADGTMQQWGQGTITGGSGNGVITYPVAFVGTAPLPIITHRNTTGVGDTGLTVYQSGAPTLTKADAYARIVPASGQTGVVPPYACIFGWMASGRWY